MLGVVVELPAASRAVAASKWSPLATDRVFHETLYGAAVSSAPSGSPSSRNCTPATPTLSDADALTVTVFDTVAPAAGVVSDTVGATVSGLCVVATAFPLSPDVLPVPSMAVTL